MNENETDHEATSKRQAELLKRIRRVNFRTMRDLFLAPLVRSRVIEEAQGEVFDRVADEEAALAESEGGGVFYVIARRLPAINELAKKIRERDKQRDRRYAKRIISVDNDKRVSPDDDFQLIDVLPDRAPTPDVDFEQRQERDHLLANLPQKHRRVAELLEQGYSETEIGDKLELSQQRVSRITIAIRSKLRPEED